MTHRIAGPSAHRTPKRIIALSVALAAGCSGGGGGSSSPLALEQVEAIDVGPLPVTGVFLDTPIRFHFSKDIDPASVTLQSVRIVLDVSPLTPARGSLHVLDHDVVFAPVLPTRPDLADVAYDVVRGGEYRVEVDGGSTGVRGRDGSTLAAGYRSTFEVRTQAPLFSDRDAGPPRVIGVMVDLDGDGVLAGDGTCRSTPQPEQFLDASAPEFASCASQGGLVDLGAVPFRSNVRVGSMARPLTVGLLFSEPLLPSSVYAAVSDTNGDGIPDGDETPLNFRIGDLTHRVDLDGDGVPDVDRALPFHVRLTQEIRTDDASLAREFVLVQFTLPFTAPLDALLRIEPTSGVAELSDARLSITPFGSTLRTAPLPETADAIVEEFGDRRRVDSISTAPWGSLVVGTLQSGTGIGGSGIGGVFPPPDPGPTLVLDTNDNGGLFEFTSFSIPRGMVVVATGPNPLRIRSIGDVDISGDLDLRGQDGEAGITATGEARRGGAGGPGGGRGGGTARPARPSLCTAQTPCESEPGAGPGAGSGGQRALHLGWSAGGGGAGSYGTRGGASFGGGVHGQTGQVYGNAEIDPLVGGSGGGGGGNTPGNGEAFPSDSTGGAGGGGGGAVLIQTNGNVTVTGDIRASGGSGGNGPLVIGWPSAGGGGGGSGGAIKIQANRIVSLFRVDASGGRGGQTFAEDGSGGGGGNGRIRLEDDFGAVGAGSQTSPAGSTATLDPTLRTTSIAQSIWIATDAPSAHYAFDASDPATGLALLDAEGRAPAAVTDVAYAAPVDSRVAVRFLFAGAQGKTTNPNDVDPATDTGFVTDVRAIDGHPFLRYRVEFDGSEPLGDLPQVGIERVRIRFRYP
ncbi:MAG: hypothetical protein HYR85_24920 [Planctomycetes bacterium]|nr:hypothetical protein [Planctomycetota bacterium]